MEQEISSNAIPKCPKCGGSDMSYDIDNGGLMCNNSQCTGKIEVAK